MVAAKVGNSGVSRLGELWHAGRLSRWLVGLLVDGKLLVAERTVRLALVAAVGALALAVTVGLVDVGAALDQVVVVRLARGRTSVAAATPQSILVFRETLQLLLALLDLRSQLLLSSSLVHLVFDGVRCATVSATVGS